jgi:metal-responsive CopG/Arc/MetJ family transcriptional regulator
MTDVVVSIRMPSSLVKELKILAQKNHFKDLSEEIRSLVRTKCLQYKNPYASELEKLREDLSTQQEAKRQLEHKQRLIEDITKILKELQNEK